MIVPADVRDWVRSVFRACNERTASALARMPTTHESALDQAFITEAARFSAPVRLPSEWIVRIDTHFLGGGRHFGSWEIADIGVLLQFRRQGKVIKTKILLLQSKRLYPAEEAYEEDERADYEIGFARLFREDASFAAITAPRRFTFQDESRYAALLVGDGQYEAIDSYETQYGIPVHYLLYHPLSVPSETTMPLMAETGPEPPLVVGARVLPAAQLRQALGGRPKGYAPSWGEIKTLQALPQARTASAPGWLVEEFIADLAVECKVGHVAQSQNDAGLFRVFNRRSGPISAAIAVTFDAPPSASIGAADG
jgi:hypothetical protein